MTQPGVEADRSPQESTVLSRLAAAALRRIYDRPQPPVPWRDGANLPWDDPAFSERMLAQHLDPSHGAASRPLREMRAQVQQMTAWLGLPPGGRLLNFDCGIFEIESNEPGDALAVAIGHDDLEVGSDPSGLDADRLPGCHELTWEAAEILGARIWLAKALLNG